MIVCENWTFTLRQSTFHLLQKSAFGPWCHIQRHKGKMYCTRFKWTCTRKPPASVLDLNHWHNATYCPKRESAKRGGSWLEGYRHDFHPWNQASPVVSWTLFLWINLYQVKTHRVWAFAQCQNGTKRAKWWHVMRCDENMLPAFIRFVVC